MKPPLSQHLAMATAEMMRRFPRLAWIDLFLVIAFSIAALTWDAHWLFILAALSLGEAAVLYVSRGFVGVLDASEEEVAALQERYSWKRS